MRSEVSDVTIDVVEFWTVIRIVRTESDNGKRLYYDVSFVSELRA